MNFDITSAINSPPIKESIALLPLRLHEVVKALYMSAIIHIPNKRVSNPSAITDGVRIFVISFIVVGGVAGR